MGTAVGAYLHDELVTRRAQFGCGDIQPHRNGVGSAGQPGVPPIRQSHRGSEPRSAPQEAAHTEKQHQLRDPAGQCSTGQATEGRQDRQSPWLIQTVLGDNQQVVPDRGPGGIVVRQAAVG